MGSFVNQANGPRSVRTPIPSRAAQPDSALEVLEILHQVGSTTFAGEARSPLERAAELTDEGADDLGAQAAHFTQPQAIWAFGPENSVEKSGDRSHHASPNHRWHPTPSPSLRDPDLTVTSIPSSCSTALQ